MKTRFLAALLLLAACVGFVLPGAPAQAQDKKAQLLKDHFPLKVGRRWIYTMRVTAGKNTQRIEYTTKVVRKEEVEGIGECFITEARSVDRLFTTEFYRVDKGQLLNPRRMEGKSTANFKGRVLLSEKGMSQLDKKDKDPISWSWESADGHGKGTVTLKGREILRIRNYGNLHCIVLQDKAVFTFKKGTVRRHQERTIWLAPGIGMVKEFMQLKDEEGTVALETEAHLKHYES